MTSAMTRTSPIILKKTVPDRRKSFESGRGRSDLGAHPFSWSRTGQRNKRSSFMHSLQERERRGAFPYGQNEKSNEFRLQCYVQDLHKVNVPQKPRRYVVITSLSLQKGLDACFLHSTHDMRPIPVQRKP